MAEQKNEPYQPLPAAGSDPDSRLRQAKHDLAAAETSGDDEAVSAAREKMADLGRERDREVAAAARRQAAASDQEARTTPPQGRAAPNKAQTVAGSQKK